MPTYDYFCTHCFHQKEVFQKMSESALVDCTECQQPTLKRGPAGGVGLQFKGTGFYITDYSSEKSSKCCPCDQSSCQN